MASNDSKSKLIMKKEYFVYVSFIFLSLAFIIISFLLRWNQNNPKLIARKIKLGAGLIVLTTILNSCTSTEPGMVTCYDVSVPDTNQTITKKDSINPDTIVKKSDTIGISSPLNRATCYGAPANFNNTKNE